ncbi:acylphosphatase [Heyndrickxia sporothermodurans]|uniref:acylphosphatase n=1 Tax=Heyndrickxia sporothermodurans TaxID=46224 RepID=UPI002E1E8205|nr:acylphosphatase [Heyndrickxia sporothermodurans]
MTELLEMEPIVKKRAEWLPHLTSEIVADARGPEFGAYTIALEGWRRGLTLKWHAKDSEYFKEMKTWSVDKPGKLFSLSLGDRTHYFFRTRGDKVTNEAVEIGADKAETKVRLMEAGISIPEGKSFKEEISDKEIINYAVNLGFPVVVKPIDGSYGRGVISNIQDKQEFKEALVHVRNELHYKDVLVERFIPGDEYRIYVVGDKVAGAIKRIPAHVIGNGVNTVRTLIGFKNKERVQNPRLISCLINIDQRMEDFIRKQGYTLDSILKPGEHLYLNQISNISKGGDPIGVTEELTDRIKNIAVQALHCIPGLTHGAVDLIIDNTNKNNAVVLELNPTAQIGGLLFPVEGKASDIPSAIIDYYFPETKGAMFSNKSKLYFDFMDVLYPLNNRTAKVTTVTPIPKGEIYAKKYIVKGNVQNIGYHRGLRKQAFERKLNGFLRNLQNGDIEVIVAGTDPAMVDDFENGLWEDPERSDVTKVVKEDWNEPVKVGFEIKVHHLKQESELKKLREEMELLQLDLNKAERRYQNYKQSLSWKISWPIRVIGKLTKKIR